MHSLILPSETPALKEGDKDISRNMWTRFFFQRKLRTYGADRNYDKTDNDIHAQGNTYRLIDRKLDSLR